MYCVLGLFTRFLDVLTSAKVREKLSSHQLQKS